MLRSQVSGDQSEHRFTYSTPLSVNLMSETETSKLCLHSSPDHRSAQIYPIAIKVEVGIFVQLCYPFMIKFLLKPNELSPYLLHSKEEPYTAGSKHTPLLENKQLC